MLKKKGLFSDPFNVIVGKGEPLDSLDQTGADQAARQPTLFP